MSKHVYVALVMLILGFVFLTIVITASEGLLGVTHNPTVDQKLDDLSREMLELRTKVESPEVLLRKKLWQSLLEKLILF